MLELLKQGPCASRLYLFPVASVRLRDTGDQSKRYTINASVHKNLSHRCLGILEAKNVQDRNCRLLITVSLLDCCFCRLITHLFITLTC